MVNNQSKQKIVAIWLSIACLVIIMVIAIGGITRLTNSGLSITEWKPITGVIPPFNASSWMIEFNKYKHSPEYLQLNKGMSLSEFQFIYSLEFIHRIIGRLAVLIFLLPFIILSFRSYFSLRKIIFYLGIAILFGMQGIMGWYMVKSGLISDPHVSHYRLGAHLILATIIYAALFWEMLKNSCAKILVVTGFANDFYIAKLWSKIAIFCLFIQIFLGALVAGLDAGLVYNSFPYMGDFFIPEELKTMDFYDMVNNFSNPVFVQFIHRIFAYILFFIISGFCIYISKFQNRRLNKAAIILFAILTLQIIFGIITIIYIVPMLLASLHQIVAMILLSILLWTSYLTAVEE